MDDTIQLTDKHLISEEQHNKISLQQANGDIERHPHQKDLGRRTVVDHHPDRFDHHRADNVCRHDGKIHSPRSPSMLPLRESIKTNGTRDGTDQNTAQRNDGIDGIADQYTADKIRHCTHYTANQRAEKQPRHDQRQIFKAQANGLAQIYGKILSQHNGKCSKQCRDHHHAQISKQGDTAPTHRVLFCFHKNNLLSLATYGRERRFYAKRYDASSCRTKRDARHEPQRYAFVRSATPRPIGT